MELRALGVSEGVSLLLCDPSGDRWEAPVDPSAGRDGPLLIAMSARA